MKIMSNSKSCKNARKNLEWLYYSTLFLPLYYSITLWSITLWILRMFLATLNHKFDLKSICKILCCSYWINYFILYYASVHIYYLVYWIQYNKELYKWNIFRYKHANIVCMICFDAFLLFRLRTYRSYVRLRASWLFESTDRFCW